MTRKRERMLYFDLIKKIIFHLHVLTFRTWESFGVEEEMLKFKNHIMALLRKF
jgi:hypothetical protein